MKKRRMTQGWYIAHLCLTAVIFALFGLYARAESTTLRASLPALAAFVVCAAALGLCCHAHAVEEGGAAKCAWKLTLTELPALCAAAAMARLADQSPILPLGWIGLCFCLHVWNRLWSRTAARILERAHPPLRAVAIYRTRADLRALQAMARRERLRIVRYVENPRRMARLAPALSNCEAVLIAGVSARLRGDALRLCARCGVPVYFEPSLREVLLLGAEVPRGFETPVLRIGGATPSPVFCFVKRTFDIAASATAMVALSPLLLAIALLVRACDHGPALYSQVRLTRNGRRFRIYKFRTMRQGAEADGVPRLAERDDERVTAVGRALRASHLDELPQLFNILIGDMSFVGPRPERPELAARIEQALPEFALRLRVRAGLTGLAQTQGQYAIAPRDKLKFDLLYMRRMSLREDLGLIVDTAATLLSRVGPAVLRALPSGAPEIAPQFSYARQL